MSSEVTGRLLVVDDTHATRYSTSHALRHAGFDVIEATTGTVAISIAQDEPVDLIVLDINLPDFDGFEVLRRIRSMPLSTRVRVVYLSASFVDDTHKVIGFEAGADGFLTHPVDPSVLIATVGALLRTRSIETELQKLLLRERLARDEAERANRAKDDFLATLSHELRSPLAAVVGWVEVARLHAQDQPALQNALHVIARNARLQSQVISDLLDVSRITNGSLGIDLGPVSLQDILQTSVEAVLSTAKAKGIVVESNLSGQTAVVNGDVGRLQQVVLNLLGNAVKFSHTGGHVRITLEQLDDHARIVVQDDGAGIAPSALPRVFDRFWQEDTSSRRSHGGLGLGLSIVRHLVELHGGTTEAFSEGEGKGATFVVTLPLLKANSISADQLRDASRQLMRPDSAEPVDLTGVRVMIVDDETDARAWVRHLVNAAGAEARDCDSVDAALALVGEFMPHVVVADLAMPKRNGFDLIADLRGRGYSAAELPVIALSAFASAEDKRRAMESGFQQFLSKPPNPWELLHAVWRMAHRDEVAIHTGQHPAHAH